MFRLTTWFQFHRCQSKADGYEYLSDIFLYPSRQVLGRTIKELKADSFEEIPGVSKIVKFVLTIVFVVLSPLLLPLTIVGILLEKQSKTHSDIYQSYVNSSKKPQKSTPTTEQELINRLKTNLEDHKILALKEAPKERIMAVINGWKEDPSKLEALIHYAYLASTDASLNEWNNLFEDAIHEKMSVANGAYFMNIYALTDEELAFVFKKFGHHEQTHRFLEKTLRDNAYNPKYMLRLASAIVEKDIEQMSIPLLRTLYQTVAILLTSDKCVISWDDQKLFEAKMDSPVFSLPLESRNELFSARHCLNWAHGEEYIL